MEKNVLKKARRLLGLSQKQLAEKIEMNQSSIQRYEAETIAINQEIKFKIIKLLSERDLSKEQAEILSSLKNK